MLLVVERTGSAAAAARELRVSISRVSKILGRVERRLGRRLFTRGTRGVALTDEGRRILPEIRALTARFTDIARSAEAPALELTIAAEPYLIAMCLPAICGAYPRLRVRGSAMAPALLRARIAEATFDAALISIPASPTPNDEPRLPATWERDRVGKIRKGLFTTPAVAERLGPIVSPAAVARETFVSPLGTEGATIFEDDCPLPAHERLIGHQIDTASVGLDVAAATGEVIFAPAPLARRHVRAKRLVEVKVRGWHVAPELWLIYHRDRVLGPVRTAIIRELRLLL